MKKNAFTGFLTLVVLASVGVATPTFAQTTDVNAQIQALLAQINILQAQLAQLQGQQNELTCSTFADLSYGNFDISPGGRVSQLQTWLGIPSNTFGFGTYGPKTRSLWNNKCGGSTAYQANTKPPVSTSVPTPLPTNQDLGTVVTTPAPTPTIDSFSVNGYSEVTNGRIHVYNVTNPVVQWSSSNASYCKATSVEGLSRAATTDFTGTQQTSGNRQLMIGDSYYNQREITLTCYNQDGVSSNTVIAWIGGKG